MQKTTIIHKYAVAPLLAIAAMHAAVWLGSKNLADFSRAFDVTLGLDALIPLRPEWVVIYVVTFLFWMMGLLFAARQDEELCFRFASGVIIAEIICCVIFIAFPSLLSATSLQGCCRLCIFSTRRRTASRRCTACSPISCSASR